LRTINVSDALIVRVVNHLDEGLLAGAHLVMAGIDAGADAEAAQFDACVAERDLVGGGAFGSRGGEHVGSAQFERNAVPAAATADVRINWRRLICWAS